MTAMVTVMLFLSTIIHVWKYDTVRETKYGKISGTKLRILGVTVEEYKGIPYAKPPMGEMRFRPPEPSFPWGGILDATLSTGCPQVLKHEFQLGPSDYTEDCLHLNVWTPSCSNEAKLPVLILVHGGGFTISSGHSKGLNGRYLAAKECIVVVSINYRLGILGFMNLGTPEAPGNVGLLDQRLAMKWVRENIDAFGGDPFSVTVGGNSAGAMSIHAHILSPGSRGLFKRAIMMSGSMNSIDFRHTVSESFNKGNNVARLVGCMKSGDEIYSDTHTVINCLLRKHPDELVHAASEVGGKKAFPFLPTLGDAEFPKATTSATSKSWAGRKCSDLVSVLRNILLNAAKERRTTERKSSLSKTADLPRPLKAEYGRDVMLLMEDILAGLKMGEDCEYCPACSKLRNLVETLVFSEISKGDLVNLVKNSNNHGFVNNVDVLTGVTTDEGSVAYLYQERDDILAEYLRSSDAVTLKKKIYDVVTSWMNTIIPEMWRYYEGKVEPDNMTGLRRAYTDHFSDRVFNCPMQMFAKRHSTGEHAVYVYVFGHRSSKSSIPKWIGTPHSFEIPYFLAATHDDDKKYSMEDKSFGDHIVRMVSSFVKDG